jgi:hypothetical protein
MIHFQKKVALISLLFTICLVYSVASDMSKIDDNSYISYLVLGNVKRIKLIMWYDKSMQPEPLETRVIKKEKNRIYYRLTVNTPPHYRYDMLNLGRCAVYVITNTYAEKISSNQKVVLMAPFLSKIKADKEQYLFHAHMCNLPDSVLKDNNLKEMLVLKLFEGPKSRLQEGTFSFEQALKKYHISLDK